MPRKQQCLGGQGSDDRAARMTAAAATQQWCYTWGNCWGTVTRPLLRCRLSQETQHRPAFLPFFDCLTGVCGSMDGTAPPRERSCHISIGHIVNCTTAARGQEGLRLRVALAGRAVAWSA